MTDHRITLPERRWALGGSDLVEFRPDQFARPVAFGDYVEIEVVDGPEDDQGTYTGFVVATLNADGVGSLAGTVTCPWCGTVPGSKCLLPPDDLGNFHASRVFHAIANGPRLRETSLPVIYVRMT